MRGALAFLFISALGVCAMSFMPQHVRQEAIDGVTPPPHLAEEASRQAEAFLSWARASTPFDDARRPDTETDI